jgi:hypothetical protein
MEEIESVLGGGRRVSRRTLIKGGAIAGGMVWAAPVIDSFVSAASAGSAVGFPCSYATIFYTLSGSSTVYAVKLNDPSSGCNNTNTDGSYGPNDPNVFTCGSLTFGVDQNNDWETTSGGTTTTTTPGSCTTAGVTVNGSTVTVSGSGVTVIAVLLHDGSLQNSSTCVAAATAAGWTGISLGAFKCNPGSSFTVPAGCCGTAAITA